MKILLAVTGASGAIYARQLLQALVEYAPNGHVSIVVTEAARMIAAHELGVDVAEDGRGLESGLRVKVHELHFYAPDDFAAPFASGSSAPDAMVVCPCSTGTLGRIAGGVSDNLIARAADVCLKERKKLILVVRETPLNAVHIANMATVTQAGAIVLPACPSFYTKPETVEQVTGTVIARVLEHLGIEHDMVRGWGR